MSSKVLILLALFVVAKASKDCGEERAQICLDSFLVALLNGGDQEKVCRDLREVSDCLRSAAGDCLNEEDQKEIEDGIRELRDALGQECPDPAVAKANEGCGEERAQRCLVTLMNGIMNDLYETEMCSVLRETSECLRSAAQACLSEAQQQEVEEGMEELEESLRRNCPEPGVRNVRQYAVRCFKANENYITQCFELGYAAASRLIANGNDDTNLIKCTTYGSIKDCVLRRTQEKCGSEVRDVLEEEMSEPPRAFKYACQESRGRRLTQVITP